MTSKNNDHINVQKVNASLLKSRVKHDKNVNLQLTGTKSRHVSATVKQQSRKNMTYYAELKTVNMNLVVLKCKTQTVNIKENAPKS